MHQQREHEQREREQPQQRWTVSDHGKIIAIPPSPSHVSTTHDYVHKKGRGGASTDDLSLPPMLVKANSHTDSSSQSSDDDHDANDIIHDDDIIDDHGSYLSSHSLRDNPNLESPPRMTRSVPYRSLFQDSIGSSSRDGSRGSRCRGARSAAGSSSVDNVDGDGDAERHAAGGCGTRLPSFDFLGTLLDVFSLNGACCRQAKSAAAGAGGPPDTILCRG
eukprot:CAMPEP_0201638848 /NCGR_PEP_ID=MMETSP0493-20130528/17743_1 /ASSEMBLY_ACC=CAM_ASM_000838 /TAXON_ID=420259 /ORGANISM="Thalassiosira gravida, Strain GMp14c1" /LENGTH=218 /DNA_ID=CAMNT_0048112041 /DNA_START=21 /DNA_END=677 /DNA_ORIENTATION=-